MNSKMAVSVAPAATLLQPCAVTRPFTTNLGGAGWPHEPFIGDQGGHFPCDVGVILCIESLG